MGLWLSVWILNAIFICLPPAFWSHYKKWEGVGKEGKNSATEKRKKGDHKFCQRN